VGARRSGLELPPWPQLTSWKELRGLRNDVRAGGIKRLVLKRAASLYVTGQPKGLGFK
jgi:hypothetical protein